MNLSIETINFHFQEYRDVTLNTKLGKKLRHTNFWHKFGFLGHFFARGEGSKKFSTGPQFSEYVWVVCRNTKGTCLKSFSKTPTVRFFRDSQPLDCCTHPAKWPILDSFWPKWAKRDFFQKSVWNIFSLLKALINCKVSEKSNEGIPRKMQKTSIFGHFGQKWPILDSFWTKWAKRDFFSKKPLEHFFRC